MSEGGRSKKALYCGSLATSADAPLKRPARRAPSRVYSFFRCDLFGSSPSQALPPRLSSSRNLRLSATINAAAVFWWAAIVAKIGSRDVF